MPRAGSGPPTITVAEARRLALHAQGLALPPARRRAGPDDVAALVARIGALQLDPVAPVARSPLLVAHARLGRVEDTDIDAATYDRRLLFEGWAHQASLVHVDDLALHRHAQRHRHHRDGSPGGRRAQEFLDANRGFAADVIAVLRERGPTRAADLDDTSLLDWKHGYWTKEVSPRQNVARMLGFLWRGGRIGVARRQGLVRFWDLFERCVPPGALERTPDLSDAEFDRRATGRALRMLGVARPEHVRQHFLRGAVADPAPVLAAARDVTEVRVEGLAGRWYAHAEDLDSLATLEPGRRTVALSPFDNLLCDRARAVQLFDLDHRLEIYTPPAKRRWGYYVLPILHRERFVARADLKIDRKAGTLQVLALHHEPGRRAKRAADTAIARLAAWRGVSVAPGLR